LASHQTNGNVAVETHDCDFCASVRVVQEKLNAASENLRQNAWRDLHPW